MVIASDTGLPSLSSQRLVSIQVLNANEPPTSIAVENSLVPSNITGLDLGRILVEDPDGPTSYTFTSLDSRFDVVAGKLMMKPQEYLKDSDPIMISIPLLINDVAGGLFLRMSVGIQRVPNQSPWQNTILPWDVDQSGSVTPLDVLTLIDAVNANPAGDLPMPRLGSSLGMPDVDVDGDGRVTPLDVLSVINRLNGTSLLGEGESQEKSDSESDRPNFVSLSVDHFFAEVGSESDPLRWRNRRR
jgi:hypothetical protein